jgi:hypothetical protein
LFAAFDHPQLVRSALSIFAGISLAVVNKISVSSIDESFRVYLSLVFDGVDVLTQTPIEVKFQRAHRALLKGNFGT